MQSFAMPICYFPSLVVFLDNGHDFLLNVMLQLNEHVAYRLFDAPLEALDFVDTYRRQLALLHRHSLSEYHTACYDFATQEELAVLYAEVYNPYRFSELSVLVVDFKARGMDGLEFCQRVGNTNVKKLLLVNSSEEAVALKALNVGLIDAYICKQEKNIVELINKKIAKLQMSYFLTMSMMISRLLKMNFPYCLFNKKFAELFIQIKEKYHIIEYYLIENSGRFLLLDEDANTSVLDIKNENNTFIPSISKFLLRHKKILSYHRYLDELDAEDLLVS